MAKGYVIYNPLAGGGNTEEDAKKLQSFFVNDELVYFDATQIADYAALLADMTPDDYLVVVGGDGTLNRFANDTQNVAISNEIYYYPAGSGNDFARDMGMHGQDKPFVITQCLQNLPSVEVNGKQYRFINGVGYGIDGYCCYVGDEMRKEHKKEIDYTGIAIKGLLFHFDSRNAKVTVDGETYEYKNVWIAPTMLGSYYGGGMIPTPDQKRTSDKLSVMVFCGKSRIGTLCVFPSIFKGAHVKHKKKVAVHTGSEITVEFDRPTPLQIDGEVIVDVTRYTARAAVPAKTKEPAGV